MKASKKTANQRRGGLLLEIILSVVIMASISLVFAESLKTSIGLLRNQELGSEQQIADTTLTWLIDRARGADQVRIVNSSTLELTTFHLPTVSERLFVRSRQLILDRAGRLEVIAEPIEQVVFSDPDGRGLVVRVDITGGSTTGVNRPRSVSRSFAIDWMKR